MIRVVGSRLFYVNCFLGGKKIMVGIFSRFSVSKAGHRRTQSALDEREVLPFSSEVTGAVTATAAVAASAAATHRVEVAVKFKPIEHPTEPFDNDQPIQCPLPEPSIPNGHVLQRLKRLT